MSKNVKINRKRLIKLTAGQFDLQIRELTDAVMGMVSVRKRQHEKKPERGAQACKERGLRRMILLFIGGLVVGAFAGIFALGLISSGHCAECRAYYDRQMEAMRKGENRWR